ncbi:MAG: carbohydrate-binding protein [Anaerolineae bacterium]|nr:carbohydrate-binding protein [Anaerolineae bacterium]
MFKHNHSPKRRFTRQAGQGFIEYAVILLLVGMAVVLILSLLWPTIEDTFRRFVERAPLAPPEIGPIGGHFTPRPAPTISFTNASPTVSEAQGTVTLFLSLSYEFYQDVVVTVSSVDGTATAGADYEPVNTTVTIPQGQTNGQFTITILQDTEIEPDETVILRLSNANISNVGPDATLTILDDDVPPAFSFAESVYLVEENQGPLQVVVRMDRMYNAAASVAFTTQNGTATGGSSCSGGIRYVTQSGTLNFPSGVNEQTITIQICNNSLAEGDANFSIVLSNPTPPGSTISGTNPVPVTIIDDETAPTITFTATNYIVNENQGTALLYVQLSRSYSTQVTVEYQTEPGTAFAPGDYTHSQGVVTFSPGVTNRIITVPITNDNLHEWEEFFSVRLSNPQPPNIPIVGNNPVTVTIIDDDCAYGPHAIPTRIEVENFMCGARGVTHFDIDEVNQGNSPYRVVDAPGVDLRANAQTGGIDLGWTVAGEWLHYDVNVAVSSPYDVIVRAASDVNGASFRLLVDGVSVTANPIQVPNTGNTFSFQNITVPWVVFSQGPRILRLEIVNGGAYFDYIQVQTTSGTTIQFNNSSYVVFENDGQAIITVDLGSVVSQPVSVNYATSNGTAIAGADYTATSGTLTIPAGQNSGTFSIPIINNTIAGPPFKTVNLALSNPVNGQLGVQTTAVLNIIDDECSFGPYNVPGRVEAENFTCGGQATGYNDTTPGNQGTSSYRFWESVDLFSGGTSNGVFVGATANGEWLRYRINVATPGFYNVTVRAAANTNNAQFSLLLNGIGTYGPYAVPNGGAGNYSNILVTGMYLTAGQHTVQLNVINTGATYDYLEFSTLSGLLLTLNDDNNTITGPNGVPLGGVNDEDIVLFVNGGYSLFFDGSDVGVGQNLQDFQLLPDGTILMTFANLFNHGGNTYNPEDIVRFTPTSLGTNTSGSFSMFFDGSQYGLGDTSNGRLEYIDGFFVQSTGTILISTVGNMRVPSSATQNIDANDEDIVLFNPTTGYYSWFIDGSDIGFDANNAAENIVAFWLNSQGHVYFSTFGNFTVSHSSTTLTGLGNDIGIFIPNQLGATTTGTFINPRYFIGGTNTNNVSGLAGELINGFFIIP